MPARTVGAGRHDEALLGRCDLFRELEPAELATLAAAARRHRLPAGSVLLREGEPGSSLYVVVEGVVEAWRERPDGRREHLNTIGAGGTLGEFSLLTGEPRSATVGATRDALLLEIGRADLAPVSSAGRNLSDALGRILAERRARTAAADASSAATSGADGPASGSGYARSSACDPPGGPALA